MFLLWRPLLRYSVGRDAYVLRFVGNSVGPVVRQNRRRRGKPFQGADRRSAAGHGSRAQTA